MSNNPLLAPVRAACTRLARHGWQKLLRPHGLDLTAVNLEKELATPLAVDRTKPGFEDFSWEGERGIEPGAPARSLLYHAFASPRVLGVAAYPTPAEIEAVENYVFGVDPPSIEDLRARASGAPLAIVVYAVEYRPAASTSHQRHADQCFSRVGVARIGTAEAKYLDDLRGYRPQVAGDGRRMRVLPCRYAAYIAAQVSGDKDARLPMRFIDPSDGGRRFWVPVHKLFDGPCLRDLSLTVRLTAAHVNDKLRRTHLFFMAHGHDGGWAEPAISDHPFVITEGIAELSTRPDDGVGLLVPVHRERLVEPARHNDRPLTFRVPESTSQSEGWKIYSSSLNLRSEPHGGRSAPEYLHVRCKVSRNGDVINLNERKNMLKVIGKGGYRALHFLDWTGDGWIGVECPQLALVIPRRLPAYSVVATPDFFPAVKQSDLTTWTTESAPPALVETIWPKVPGRPEALSEQRLAANIEIKEAGFEITDDTVTAIVGMLGSGKGRQTRLDRDDLRRVSTLSDAAAGIFAPGWDVSFDRTQETEQDEGGHHPGVNFLATHGLGSPFPEDAKLCAALSSFWPAVAPDITRTFEPSPKYASATPLTDKDIGMEEAPPWDGIRGPHIDRKKKKADYPALAYADYVQVALENAFDISVIAETSFDQYVTRTLTTARAYDVLGARTTEDKVAWALLSFTLAKADDPEFQAAARAKGAPLDPVHTYRFEMARTKSQRDGDLGRKVVQFDEIVLVFADPVVAVRRTAEGAWTKDELPR